jgi:ABC-type sugar transport system permease subunit
MIMLWNTAFVFLLVVLSFLGLLVLAVLRKRYVKGGFSWPGGGFFFEVDDRGRD